MRKEAIKHTYRQFAHSISLIPYQLVLLSAPEFADAEHEIFFTFTPPSSMFAIMSRGRSRSTQYGWIHVQLIIHPLFVTWNKGLHDKHYLFSVTKTLKLTLLELVPKVDESKRPRRS